MKHGGKHRPGTGGLDYDSHTLQFPRVSEWPPETSYFLRVYPETVY